ncbi:MAG TPA: CHAD domain-containing protein, partial [Thermoanaerobaculia bacterium]|nr:CHAD domain-containing protein [Thermoanaerobaculia bacterium]
LPPPIGADAIQGLTDTLLAARRRVAAWPADGIKRDEVWSAFRRSYGAGRRAMSDALETNRPELLHEWRKRVKAHWHHSELVTDAGLARLEKYAKKLHKLSDVLGEHHDLVVLDQLLRQSPESFGSPIYIVRFLAFVARRLRDLEERAASDGAGLFAERPKMWEELLRASMLRHGPKRAERRYPHNISNVQVASPRH